MKSPDPEPDSASMEVGVLQSRTNCTTPSPTTEPASQDDQQEGGEDIAPADSGTNTAANTSTPDNVIVSSVNNVSAVAPCTSNEISEVTETSKSTPDQKNKSTYG